MPAPEPRLWLVIVSLLSGSLLAHQPQQPGIQGTLVAVARQAADTAGTRR
jgi:hypothetical protein